MTKTLFRRIDLRTIIYALSVLFLIFAGWFSLKERVAVMASDIGYNKSSLAKQEKYLETIKKDVNRLHSSVIRIEVMLEHKLNINKKTCSTH